MNEVEKMYENCKIKKQYCGWLDMGDLDTQYTYVRCDSLEEFNDTAMMSRTSYSSEEEDWDKPSIEYPPFTAEKQLEIVKMILFSTWWINLKRLQFSEKFDEGLAQMINELWQDLTEAEKAQIKEILE